MKFFIKTYGCQMNVNDSEKMGDILKKRGFSAADDENDADIIIINSCAVREKPQEKIFSFAGRLPKGKKIIVAGCVAQSEKQKILERNPNIDYIVGTHQYYQIDRIADEILAQKSKGDRGVKAQFSKVWQEAVPDIASRISRVSGYISIMEGCDNFCSYCIVPFTRGREKHRPFENIMAEAEYLATAGYKEIILLGQNVNSWEDKEKNMEFPDLLERLSAAPAVDVKWIRFITSYPGYYDEQLIEVMARHEKIARNIHFPVQSGSTRVLKKMNRSYTRAQYLDIVRRFKKKIPDITFSSDFIVGFPGETENDFELTLSLLEKVEYENIFSFLYSPRRFTSAFKLKDDITPEIKKQRLYRLQELQKNIQFKNNKTLLGKTIEVLVTGPHPKAAGEVIGRTVNYRVVNFKSDTPVGEFTRVLIERVGPYSLRAKEHAARAPYCRTLAPG
ncbi:MAG: tRNA (N6-isopentenyl adenosine(37)-C2)-methylthiotransferase MiaB [Candidatus Aminicenantes bacterium]|nr:tRNA (N6-isopentenyl adenosine(37)-C2)-methylthiotransferase MiaB [Candidatus Aminicenantes bacterium]